MNLFRKLSQEEEIEFRQWARTNYVSLGPIKGIWHPVIRDECVIINKEHHEHNKN